MTSLVENPLLWKSLLTAAVEMGFYAPDTLQLTKDKVNTQKSEYYSRYVVINTKENEGQVTVSKSYPSIRHQMQYSASLAKP